MTPPSSDLIHDSLARIQKQVCSGQRWRIRGAGTKDFYGAFDANLPVLDLQGLSGIVSYEPTELVVTALAGTPLLELERVLEAQNQYLPFEPPRFAKSGLGGATVGGMVASGLSGPARASVGALREYVLGAQIINGRGELLRFGGEVIKNVAGYDVSRLMVGSLGNLGLITAVSLKVLGRSAAECTLKMEMGQQAALDALNHWGSQALPLNASVWMPHRIANGAEALGATGCLYLRLRGARAAVAAARQGLQQSHGALEAAEFDWEAIREQSHAFFQNDDSVHSGQALWRLSVPQTTPALSLPPDCSASLVEWHGGLRWLWADLLHARALHELAHQYNGHATLYRFSSQLDAGQSKVAKDVKGGATQQATAQACRFASLEPTVRHLNDAVKAAFDPHRVFHSRDV